MIPRHAARLIAGGTANHGGCFVRASAKRAERHPRLGELRRVDMPNLIAKVISHVGQTGARLCQLVCRGTPKFRAMVLSALRRFLRSIMVKLRSRPSFHVQFNAAAGSPKSSRVPVVLWDNYNSKTVEK